MELESTKINSQLKYDKQYDEIRNLRTAIEDYKKRNDLLASLQSQLEFKDGEIEQLQTKIEKLEEELLIKNVDKVQLDQNENALPNVRRFFF